MLVEAGFRIVLLPVCLLIMSVSPIKALIISSDGLLTKILENNFPIRSFYFEIETRVYDPEAFSPLEETVEDNLVPLEKKENAYFQKVVWVRDEYYLVETLDYSEKPLHMYISEPVWQEYGRHLQETRFFTNEDVVYPYLCFFSKHLSFLKANLEDLGINSGSVAFKEMNNGVVYQLGDELENILVDPQSFKVIAINRLVQVSGRYFPLSIMFTEWDDAYPRLPLKTDFFINSRLFKEMRIVAKQRHVYTPRRHFLTRYHKTLPENYPFNLEVNYGN